MTAQTTDVFGLVGGTLDGKYDVERVVAEGGFGVVYRATHCGLRRPVAIKVLKVPENLDVALRGVFAETFAQEARLIAGLDHPAAVRVLDFGVGAMPSGAAVPWMALEWIEGTSLESALDARRGAGGRSPAEALALLRPVLEAITLAHEAGIAHRDLKPANLMVVPSRRGGAELRVLDFGIAKTMGDEEHVSVSGRTATHSRLQACSPPYAAPEQVSGTRTGPWTDVHALGLILTELLTDAPPYPGDDLTELYAAALSPTRPTPARVGVDVGAWEAVLVRAVAMRPAERFQHAGALLAALDAEVPERAPSAVTDESITTPRAGAAVKARTTLRPAEVQSQPSPRRSRGRGVLIAVGGLALLSALALAVTRGGGGRSAPRTIASVVAKPPSTATDVAVARREPTPAAPTVVVAAADAGSPQPQVRRSRATGTASRRAVLARNPPAQAPAPATPAAQVPPRFIPAE